jgi:hypothetical protein
VTAVEYGKSRKFYETHCGICSKKFSITEDRYKGHCTFKNDEELDFLACEKCARDANIDTAIKQTKELGEHDGTGNDGTTVGGIHGTGKVRKVQDKKSRSKPRSKSVPPVTPPQK